MNIETKFEPGKPVWFMYKNKPFEGTIEEIRITSGWAIGDYLTPSRIFTHISVSVSLYQTSDKVTLAESDIFPTKAELLESL